MRQLIVSILAGVLAVFTSAAQAQAWPSRPVRIALIVPPGGLPDLVAR